MARMRRARQVGGAQPRHELFTPTAPMARAGGERRHLSHPMADRGDRLPAFKSAPDLRRARARSPRPSPTACRVHTRVAAALQCNSPLPLLERASSAGHGLVFPRLMDCSTARGA
jgi:hypothetical protein